MPSATRAPQKKVFEGETFYSIQAAAQVLNRSPRTLRRLEQAGVVAKPRHQLPGGREGQRWYSAKDLEDLRRLVAESGFGERQVGSRGRLQALLDALPGQARISGRKPSWADEAISNRPRELLHRRKQGDIDPMDWMPPSARRRQPELRPEPLPPPDACPVCGVEVTWIAERVPGGSLMQVPCCELHGVVSLAEPEVDPNVCPDCGLEVVYDLVDDLEGFQPTCELHGPVRLPTPSRTAQALRQEPFQHQVDFGAVYVETGRPRGLRQSDVIGAVRAPRRQAGSRITFIDPHMGPTRPG
jgi:hypothetical protein